MPLRTPIKDLIQEIHLFKFRSLFSAIVCIVLIGLLLSRLLYLQVLEHEHFETLSDKNRVRLKAVPPKRGLIFDRRGVVLAENRPAFRLELIPEEVEDMEGTLEALGEIVVISESELERFRSALRRHRSFEAIPLRTKLNEEEVARLAVNQHRFPGMEINAGLSRHYPLGKRAVHAIGYVGRIDEDELKNLDAGNYTGTSHIGKVGVERYYEDVLHGHVGYQKIEVNVQGRALRVVEEVAPQPGQDLILGLDIGLQMVAEDAFEGESGAVVAIEPHTGEVLVLASVPTYDPNLFVHGISTADFQALQKAEGRPQFNRVLSGQYPPGSTIKPFVGLAGLEHQVMKLREGVFCQGYYKLPNDERRYRDWKRWGHGFVDHDSAVAESCDVYFYELAYRLGIDRMSDFLLHFGFGQRTGIDIVGERSGLLPSREWKRRARNQVWFPGETLITGIGQGYMLATPLQLASATATLALHGRHMAPRLLRATQQPATGEIDMEVPRTIEQIRVISDDNWLHAIKAMEDVVHSHRGTARATGVGLNYRMAGKTGTAQVFGIPQDEEYDAEKIAKRLRDHALFIAFAPAENPRIAVAVVVENGGSGSAVAAPIARKVIDHYLSSK